MRTWARGLAGWEARRLLGRTELSSTITAERMNTINRDNIALRARQKARGKRQKLTKTAFAAFINLLTLMGSAIILSNVLPKEHPGKILTYLLLSA